LPRGVAEFEKAHPEPAGCAALFEATVAGGLEKVFTEHPDYTRFEGFNAFTEYAGPNSFAGTHRREEAKELVLFDVWAEGYGMVGPFAFLGDFGHLRVPRVVYRGRFTGQFAEDVRRGRYGVREGVVVKGGSGGADVWMAKVKTYAYQERLKRAFAEGWKDFWE
jgi:hypothetical protein